MNTEKKAAQRSPASKADHNGRPVPEIHFESGRAFPASRIAIANMLRDCKRAGEILHVVRNKETGRSDFIFEGENRVVTFRESVE